jgi:chemotaxis protein CheY-P-specific phosphatase CheC
MREKTISKVEDSMVAAVERTFSDMAFLDVIGVPEISGKLKFGNILYISFTEPEEGEIALFLPSECKRRIVENIYGSDWSTLHDTEIDDCLLEMLNVLAGNFLSNCYGEAVKHNLSLPELRFDDSGISRDDKFANFYFDAEEMPFMVSLCFKKQ